MNLTDNPYVKSILQKYGPQWDPTVLAEQQGADSAAGFAVDFEKYASSILAGKDIAARCPKLKTDFIFVENAAVNGFAGKIAEHHEHYVIGVFAGTITKLFDIFSRQDYLSSLRQGVKKLSTRSDWELRQFSLYFSTLFLVYHEFGHVFRGHLNYAKSDGQSSSPWMESQAEPPPDSKEYTERRHLSECDADAFAGMLLAGEIQQHAKKIAENVASEVALVRDDITVIAATAIHFLFCIFDSKTEILHPYYPPPHIRSAIVHAHIATQLHTEGVGEEKLFVAIMHGLEKAETVKKKLGMKEGCYDLAAEYASWTAMYTVRLSNLSKNLVDFSPCNR